MTVDRGPNALASVAIVVWSLIEMVAGSSPLRRVLGAIVLLCVLAGRLPL